MVPQVSTLTFSFLFCVIGWHFYHTFFHLFKCWVELNMEKRFSGLFQNLNCLVHSIIWRSLRNYWGISLRVCFRINLFKRLLNLFLFLLKWPNEFDSLNSFDIWLLFQLHFYHFKLFAFFLSIFKFSHFYLM